MKSLAFQLWNFLPDSIRMFLDILRRCHLWNKNKALFIHVPKAAGVSVNNAIYGRPLGHFYAKDIQRICPKFFMNVFSFSVVRHPVDRLYSAYQFSKNGGTEVMSMGNSNYYINHPDFQTFDLFVNKWLAKQNLLEIDGVFRPQYLYICDKKFNILIDKVYKLENIEAAACQISKKIDKKIMCAVIDKDQSISNTIKIPKSYNLKLYNSKSKKNNLSL